MSSGKSDPKRTVVDAIEDVRWLREETGKTFYAVGAPGAPSRGFTWSRRAIRCTSSISTTSRRRGARRGPPDRGAERQVAREDAGRVARRVDTLPLACLALDRLLAALKPAQRRVLPPSALREGFYYSRLSEREQARHPLIAFAEEQGAGWRRFDLSPMEIFDWLTPVFAGESDGERILRTARMSSQ